MDPLELFAASFHSPHQNDQKPQEEWGSSISFLSPLLCDAFWVTREREREKKRGSTCLWPKVSPLHHLISKHFTSTCETRLYCKNDGNYQRLQCPRCSFRLRFCWTDMTAKWFEGVFKMKIFESKVNMLIFTPFAGLEIVGFHARWRGDGNPFSWARGFQISFLVGHYPLSASGANDIHPQVLSERYHLHRCPPARLLPDLHIPDSFISMTVWYLSRSLTFSSLLSLAALLTCH